MNPYSLCDLSMVQDWQVPTEAGNYLPGKFEAHDPRSQQTLVVQLHPYRTSRIGNAFHAHDISPMVWLAKRARCREDGMSQDQQL